MAHLPLHRPQPGKNGTAEFDLFRVDASGSRRRSSSPCPSVDLSRTIMAASLSAKRRIRIRKVRASRYPDERRCPGVEPPAQTLLTMDDAFKRGRPQLDLLRDHFYSEGRVRESVALRIIYTAAGFFREEANLLQIDGPVNICGNIQGQFYDLLQLFEVGGSPKKTRYLFLGDYVNRGSFSIECVLYLFALKVALRQTFFLLRGHHESRHLCEHFTFKRECNAKYSQAVYSACLEAFDCLPLAALVDQALFCVHGGLSPDLETLSDINAIDRFREPPNSGLMCDLLWCDPASKLGSVWTDFSGGFIENKARRVSHVFSFQAASAFLERNGLLGIVRSHQPLKEGYELSAPNKLTRFPAVTTIFSAPNYVDFYGNKGALLAYEREEIRIKQWRHVPHPYWLPNFEDAFSWSFPFLVRKINEILFHCVRFYTKKKTQACRDERTRFTTQSPDSGAPTMLTRSVVTSGKYHEDDGTTSSWIKLMGRTARTITGPVGASSRNTSAGESVPRPASAPTKRAHLLRRKFHRVEQDRKKGADHGETQQTSRSKFDPSFLVPPTESLELEKEAVIKSDSPESPACLRTPGGGGGRGLSSPSSPVSLPGYLSISAVQAERSPSHANVGIPITSTSHESSPSLSPIAVQSPLQGSVGSGGFHLPTITIN